MHRQTTHGPIAVVLGTRSAAGRLAAVVRALGEHALVIRLDLLDDDSVDDKHHRDLSLPDPHVRLDGFVGRARELRIAAAVSALTTTFKEQRSAAVIVQGDTDYASAGAQAARCCGVPLIQVEAGLRSHGHVTPQNGVQSTVGIHADVHCAATLLNAANLVAENTDPKSIGITGSVVVESALAELPSRAESLALLARLGLVKDGFILAALGRPENTAEPGRLETILRELVSLPLPVVLMPHPRTDRLIHRHGLGRLARKLRRPIPVDHSGFLGLALHTRLLISDLDAVQEECTVVKKPLIVIGETTERPEAIHAGFAVLAVAGPQISRAARAMLDNAALPERLAAVGSPYGDGKASWRMGLLALAVRNGVPTNEATATVCISPFEALRNGGVNATSLGSAVFPPGSGM